ncbi:mitochondrial adenine nucleotide transporter ADNT1-like [Andrographis paniculata]|uniref:mitochondrial adenine nucleotide transporter ADNT1-like n=1 Tax=Andrographis paniculata TaxID=175694 RepID=UPI0021E91122|nr:mitochondrial adenine nucleotide transporter ADNT1-like [Andrographis paniculata]
MASEDGKPTTISTIMNIAEKAKDFHGVKYLAAGGIAGGVSRTAVAPLERLKILIQVQPPENVNYNGTIQGLKYIWRTEGLRGMFKGNGSNCVRIVPNSAVGFYSYEEVAKGALWLYRQETGNENAQSNSLVRFGAGSCAGAISLTATYPLDMVQGRLSVQTDKSSRRYRGIFHALRTVMVEEGPRALYKGWLPSVIGVIPYLGFNFSVYESSKEWVLESNPHILLSKNTESNMAIISLACGAAAGIVSQTVTYPLDVIRRRMQIAGWKDAASVITGDGKGKAPPEYNGMVDAFLKTIRSEGFGALFKGWMPNAIKMVPCTAVSFVTYELVKDYLGAPPKK